MIKHEPTEPWIAELESQASARLKAAAPELLEALKAIMALPHAADQLDILRRGIGTKTPAKAWLEARAAIAKAEGKTE